MRVGSLAHGIGGAERNWSTHTFINSDLRKSQTPKTLERAVRLQKNMRLADTIEKRGMKKIKEEPKEYPLERGDWSSCDESEDDAPTPEM